MVNDMTSVVQIIFMLLDVVWFVVVAHIIMSWLINFQVLNVNQPIVMQIWRGLTQLLQPLYGPLRRWLPQIGGLDLAPLVVILGIMAIKIVLQNNI